MTKPIDHAPVPDHAPLGRQTEYRSSYDASLLFPIAREQSRQNLGLEQGNLPFRGEDVWTGFELSWLNLRGKPVVAVAEFRFACDSPNIVESKSFKLYLNSFNQTRFDSREQVLATLERDLSAASGRPVAVRLSPLDEAEWGALQLLEGDCLDDLDIDVEHYHPAPELLCADGEVVSESLYSHLLKSNCPVTGQPDWASVHIRYTGPAIDRPGLLKYVVSFREHQDFHENCVERIFTDILKCCGPKSLTVFARYTRRGGLDINPLRTTEQKWPEQPRLLRQ